MIVTLPATTDLLIAFPSWVAQYCNPTSVVLDVGAGRGKLKSPAIIKECAGRLVGVDPDPAITQNPYLDEWYCSSIEDFAKEAEGRFDLLYSMMVLEHVTQPRAFFSACRSLLKPGGMFFAVTPNLWHYFGLTTKLCATLKLEEWVLDRLIGKSAKEEYHFPTAYRVNSVRAIQSILMQTGLRDVEFQCFDQPFSYNYLVPKRLRCFPQMYSRAIYMLNMPHLMGHIMFRATA